MTTIAPGTFHNQSWDEQTLDEFDGREVTKATIVQDFDGDIGGSGTWTTIMGYASDGTAEYVGMQRIVGRIGDRSGSFVIRTDGTFDGSAARSTWAVVADSGTEALAGLRGSGNSVAPHGPDARTPSRWTWTERRAAARHAGWPIAATRAIRRAGPPRIGCSHSRWVR